MKQEKLDLRLLMGLRFAVIGEGTRRALQSYGLFADYMPERYYARDLGKGLAETLLEEAQGKRPETALLLRARKASDALTEELLKAGISFEEKTLYDTVLPDASPQAERVKELLKKQDFSFVTFTSASTVEGFLNLLNPDAEELSGFTAVCIGEETRRAASAAGMKTIVSDKPSMDSMAECMERFAAR